MAARTPSRRRRELLEQFSLFYLLSVVMVVAAFCAFDDALFFNSDVRSVLVFCGSVALAPTAALALASAASRLLGRPRAVRSAAEAAIPALIVAIVTLLLLDFLQERSRIIGFVSDERADVLIVFLCAVLFIVVGIRRWRRRGRGDMERRVTALALALSPACAIAAVGLVAWGHLVRPAHGSERPRHVVLVVLDAWPATSYLHTYNPSVPPRPVDELFQDALVFRHMHTNMVWTFGFFDTLYRGVSRYEFRKPAKGDGPRWDLLTALQGLGVKTRWVVYHRIGIPESHFVSGYRGFRSIHLTHRHAQLLRALALDYNVISTNATVRQLLATPRRRLLFDALNTDERCDDELHDVLLPEIRSLQHATDRSFLLYHGRWPAGPFSLPAAWDEATPANAPERERLAAAIKANDNRYGPEAEWYAAELRAKHRYYMDLVGEKIVRLVDDMKREDLLENTLLILTADHGSMFERGRLWYTYHPDEEVTRVPLVMFNAGRNGYDDTLHESVDITRTLVEYFGGTSVPSPRATSLLAPGPKPFTSTITHKSEKNHEWFLILYAPDGKHVFNLEPGSGGENSLVVPTARDDSVVTTGPEAMESVEPFLRRAMIDYGLRAADVHPRYRPFLSGTR